MAKRPVQKIDFSPYGAAIKAARTGQKESRNKVGNEMYLSPRYLANIENKGQHPSLQIFFELMSRYPCPQRAYRRMAEAWRTGGKRICHPDG